MFRAPFKWGILTADVIITVTKVPLYWRVQCVAPRPISPRIRISTKWSGFFDRGVRKEVWICVPVAMRSLRTPTLTRDTPDGSTCISMVIVTQCKTAWTYISTYLCYVYTSCMVLYFEYQPVHQSELPCRYEPLADKQRDIQNICNDSFITLIECRLQRHLRSQRHKYPLKGVYGCVSVNLNIVLWSIGIKKRLPLGINPFHNETLHHLTCTWRQPIITQLHIKGAGLWSNIWRRSQAPRPTFAIWCATVVRCIL